MSIFDNISRKVSETAKAAAKKSGDLVEVTKLTMSIGAEEDKIKKTFTEIGKAVYESYKAGDEINDSLRELCAKVESYEKNIESMKQKILELRNVKVCPGCGIELEIDMAYCYKCGLKQPVPQVQTSGQNCCDEPQECEECEDSEESEESEE